MTTEGFPDAEDIALMKALKGAISESDYVVETMAAKVGISKESLGRYLRSEREMGVGTFAKICQALHVTRAEMYERADRILARAAAPQEETEPAVLTIQQLTAAVPETPLTAGTERSTREQRGTSRA